MRTTGRLRPRRPADLDPAARAVRDAITGGRRAGGPFQLTGPDGELLGPFNAMLAHPRLGAVLQRLGEALRFESALPAEARELVILRVAVAWRSEYEWYAHAAVARDAGVPDAVLEELRAGGRPGGLGAAAEAALRLCERQLGREPVPDDEYAHAVAVLGEVGVVEVGVLVGYYCLLAGLLSTFEVPVPPGAATAFPAGSG